MRRLFSLFIVLLLVLRGLLGAAMAMGEMAAAPSPSFVAALQDQGESHHASPDQHAHGSSPDAGCTVPDCSPCEHAHGHGLSCAACGICHSTVSPTASLARTAEAAAGIRPAGLSPRFVSAWPLQAVKPPIS